MKSDLIPDAYPLSPMQQGMLFHALSGRAAGVDVEQVLCDLPEPVNAAALERALQHVAERHAVLRTSFHWEGLAEPRQEVEPHAPVPFHREDWRGMSSEEQGRRLTEYLLADRQRGFALATAPLARVALFERAAADWQLVWTFHHLLLDGRALVLVLNDIFACYEAFCEGRAPELKPPRPYHDYIAWQLRLNLAKAETFWRAELAGFSAPTPLVAARPVGAAPAAQGDCGEQQIRLSAAITDSLKALAQAHQLTLNTIVQGAWALLLSRYSGEEDIVFGAVRACRHSSVEGAESIVGLLINTVPLRVRVPADLAVIPWLKTVRAQWLALREFEHTPLMKLQTWSEVPRGQPLFESIVNFQDPSWDAALKQQGGPWARREFGIRSQSNYPLAVDACGGKALLMKILYHRTRFEDAAIARMLGHLKRLIEAMMTNPTARLAELPLVTEAERHQLLVEWNNTDADFPRDKSVHELFEMQARRTPQALALADGSKRLSYGELNAQADSLAQRLRARGVGPEVCVGVCMNRSVELVVAWLAVLKAGGAYVPLDPAYPRGRLAFMLDDAKTPVLLTQESLRPGLQFEAASRVVFCVDSLDETTRRTRRTTPPPRQDGNHPGRSSLAYVIYTSGSTGAPKGVEIEHASLVNLITWHQREYRVTPSDRATQLATPAFDASVWELWPYLTAGASIHIPDEETRLSPKKLVAWLAEHRITLSFVPTPLAEAMLDEAWPENCSLRALLTGGDKLHRFPGGDLPCPLVNHYGPTESTVVTTWTIVPRSSTSAGAPPIGRPIANTRTYILDHHLQPVPIGVPGELHIGGVGLARGYHKRSKQTAAKFIPDPFSADEDARLYKTGDRARWLPDGQIEFLDRLDNQVKIRGHRIELGEIESLLLRHPEVREAVVTPRMNAKGESRLVACVVPARKQPPNAAHLREFLKQKLPDYMVPSAFTVLARLPLTPNGKVDRAALPAPDWESDVAFIAPRTPAEERLAAIWCEVLGIKQAGVHDNFFELGGHSLMATQVISRVRTAFQVELPFHCLFDTPTIAGLAQRIEAMRGGPADASREMTASDGEIKAAPQPIVRKHHSGAQPLSFAQERLWFLEQMEPGLPFNNIPLAIRLEGPLDLPALDRAFSEIVRRHPPLRTRFASTNGQPTAITAAPEPLHLAIQNLAGFSVSERAAELERLSSEEAQRPFDLTRGPLLRVRLARLGAEEHRLLLTTHHTACDGWSLGVFYRELTALYAAFSRGRPAALPELPIDYADYARWQREQLQGEVLERELAYWKDQLAGAPTSLELPTDQPRPPVQTHRGAMQHFTLPNHLSTALHALARREDATLFMLLLAAFQTLLHRYTGQEDILVGSPIAGRTRTETEHLIGCFLNTLVLRGDMSGDPTFHELVQRIRKTTLAAYAHQEVPFEKLVDTLQPGRDLSRPPLFQVMFILQNEPLHPLELTGLKLTPLPLHSGTAKFDLTLSLEETADGLAGHVEFNTDLFGPATITRLLGHYQTLLEAVVEDTDEHLSQLPLLTEDERREILVGWNNTRAEFARNKCVHQLFTEQVGRTPDEVALVFGDAQLTYRELDRRANAVAVELQALGVGPDVRVGICVRRSLEMVAGLLGILKAGGCYVPLDPTYPKERLTFMLEDARVPVLLTQDRLQAELRFEMPNLALLCLDAPRFIPRGTAHEPMRPSALRHRPSAVTPSHLAYVIYTSGSTGRPKGVMVTHRNVVNFFAGMDRELGTEPGVWLAVTSISFDISVLELFWTLARGFKVVIQPDEDRAPVAASPGGGEPASGQGHSVPEQILRHGVSHMQCTPSLAMALALAPESLPAMRSLDRLLLGGEALPVALAQQLRAVTPRLLNMYGPTETTIWSAVHSVREVAHSVPIGRPIANTQLYILDRNLEPVPVGVAGEIFIGGEGVARGYLNRPELTAEKFIPNPFISGPNQRIYHTGDLGRWRTDGSVEFLGRLDHQVKIRGHRVELGEIELVLGRHPAVREAVVVAREDTPGDTRLVAYVVTDPAAKATANELRHFAREALPEAMTPSTVVFLGALPLTPNGKVNRKALPAPEVQRPELETHYLPPRTELEKTIAGTWRELLHVEKVGLHDNFFDLGGHSLLVVQAQAQLRVVLGRDLPVVKLFQYPTISALAAFLSERESSTSDALRERGRRKQAAARRAKPEHAVMA